ncbi:MAG: AAA family ATPase [Chloroflexota bacterium]|nr:AAA family ATPase [Chloroflexota bacterium]
MPRPLVYKQQLNRKGGACAKDCGVIMMPNSYEVASIAMTNSSLTKRIDRIEVRNYRSLGDVNLDLSDLTVLVGPNGSGKSNVLDVLRFVSDALRLGLEVALVQGNRGEMQGVRTRSLTDDLGDVSISLYMTLYGVHSEYHLVLGSHDKNDFFIKTERCVVGSQRFLVHGGVLEESTMPYTITTFEKSLLLPLLLDSDDLLDLYRFLTFEAGYYSILSRYAYTPRKLASLVKLDSDAANLATVLWRIANTIEDQNLIEQIYEGFANIVPGLDTRQPFRVESFGNFVAITIQHQDGSTFDLASESDGTIRILGLLTAIYQIPRLKLIAIEEPELIIHPGALGVLCDIFKEASLTSQIILTTHSPDMISRFAPESLRLVTRENGLTQITPVSEDNIKAINDQLFTAGDLLRIGAFERV